MGIYPIFSLDFQPVKEHGAWVAVARCTLACFLAALAVAIQPVQDWGGQIAALVLIVFFIKPPGEATFLFAVDTLFLCLTLGAVWGWSVLGMKFTIMSRNHHWDDQRLAEIYNDTYATYGSNTTQAILEEATSIAILHGKFLQTGPTFITVIFFFIATYWLFILRTIHKRFFFLMVIGFIPLCLYGAFGPLVPRSLENGALGISALGYIFFEPFSYYLAICGFCILAIPTSIKSALAAKFYLQLSFFKGLLQLQNSVVSGQSQLEVGAIVPKLNGMRAAVVGINQFVDMHRNAAALEMDVSVWSAADLSNFFQALRRLGISTTILTNFFRQADLLNSRYSELATPHESRRGSDGVENPKEMPGASGSPPSKILSKEIEAVFQQASFATSELNVQLINGVDLLVKFANDRASWNPWGILGPKTDVRRAEEMRAVISRIRTEIAKLGSEDYLAPSRDKVLALKELIASELVASPIFTPETAFPPVQETLRSTNVLKNAPLYLFELYIFAVIDLANSLIPLLEISSDVDSRTKLRFQWPSFDFKRTLRLVLGTDSDGLQDSDNPEVIPGTKGLKSLAETRDRPQLSTWKRLATRAVKYCESYEHYFSWKAAILGTAMMVPSWTRANDSCWFFYRERGIWAVILGASGVLTFSGEVMFLTISRMIGTTVAGIVALVGWYMSAGSGDGNPYGFVAVVTILGIPLLIYRILLVKNFSASISATTSFVLIMGYSYVDEHQHLSDSPGKGVEVVYKRIALVYVALLGILICNYLIHWWDGKDWIRTAYATTSMELANVSAALITELRCQSELAVRSGSVSEEIATTLVGIHSALRSSEMRLSLSQMEPSLTRNSFSLSTYRRIQMLQIEIGDFLGQLLLVSAYLDPTWRTNLLSSFVFKGESLQSLSTLFYVIHSSLQGECAIPLLIPALMGTTIEEELHHLDEILDDAEFSKAHSAFTIANGTLIHLHQILKQHVIECQNLFGKEMKIR